VDIVTLIYFWNIFMRVVFYVALPAQYIWSDRSTTKMGWITVERKRTPTLVNVYGTNEPSSATESLQRFFYITKLLLRVSNEDTSTTTFKSLSIFLWIYISPGPVIKLSSIKVDLIRGFKNFIALNKHSAEESDIKRIVQEKSVWVAFRE